MAEKNFLAYVLYMTLIEIRTESYESGNKRIFWLTNILHNVPLRLLDEESIHEAYRELCENAKELEIENWLQKHKKEFYENYPQFKDSLPERSAS